MKVTLVLVAVLSSALALPRDDLVEAWGKFKLEHEKRYSPVEEQLRYQIFKKNLADIEAHNQLYNEGKTTFTKAPNQFADLTHEEFVQYLTKFQMKESDRSSNERHLSPPGFTAPNSVDWRNSGAVGPVVNQGGCGSCWAFSAVGALEGQDKLRNGRLSALSQQQLVDCSRPYGTMGCSGGWMDDAFRYVKDHGIATSQNYPYIAADSNCKDSQYPRAMSISGIVDINPDENSLRDASAQAGPISVAFDASYLQFYGSGIYDDNRCSQNQFTHAVIIIGYGTENGRDYWLARNSWGNGWGEQGFFRLARNYGNICGIASKASYPRV